MIRYYPSFAIKTDLSVGESLVDSSGQSYSGKFYETTDGDFYSGPNPVVGPNEPLIKASDYMNSQGSMPTQGQGESPTVQTTNGNDFLLNGVPYVGPYYQDPNSGNYYTAPTPTTTQSPNTYDPSYTGQSPASTSDTVTNPMPSSEQAIPPSLPEEIVNVFGEKLVLNTNNELVPVTPTENPIPQPKLLQPIAAAAKDGSVRRFNPSVIPPQEFLYGLRVNPNFFGRPAAFYPVPTEQDYSKGFFYRYFAKKVNQNGYIVEISYNEYAAINNGEVTYDVSLYQTLRTFWKLTGPLRSVRLAQYDIREGIIDTNKRLIEGSEKNFLGITTFIDGEYSKFSRPTA